MQSINKVKNRELYNVFCCKCDGEAHMATHYYMEQESFFDSRKRVSVCADWLEKKNIRVSNPNVSPILKPSGS